MGWAWVFEVLRDAQDDGEVGRMMGDWAGWRDSSWAPPTKKG